MHVQMRWVRAKGVEAVFVLAGAQRRGQTDRPRAIHINRKKGVARMLGLHAHIAAVLQSYKSTGRTDLREGVLRCSALPELPPECLCN